MTFVLLGLSLCAPTLGKSMFTLLGLSLCASTDPTPKVDPPTTPDPPIADVARRGMMNLSARSPVRGGDVESGDGRCGDVDNRLPCGDEERTLAVCGERGGAGRGRLRVSIEPGAVASWAAARSPRLARRVGTKLPRPALSSSSSERNLELRRLSRSSR